MENCIARTVVFPVNHASTNKKNGNQNCFSTPLGGVGERSSRKSSGNFTLMKAIHILLIALLSLLLQNNHTHEQTGTLKLQCASRYSRNLSKSQPEKSSISSKTNSKGSSQKKAPQKSDNTKSTVDIAPNAPNLTNDKKDISGSQVDSNIGVKIDNEASGANGSKAASDNGSKAASAKGSKAASAKGSKAASANGSKAESANGSKAESANGSKAASAKGSKAANAKGNNDDSTVTLIKNKNTKDSAGGAQKGSSNIKKDPKYDSSSEELNTTGGKAIVKESTNQDNSADSKNEEEVTPDVINHLVKSLNETVRMSEMMYIFIVMMTLEKIKYDKLRCDLTIYADDAAEKQTAPEKYKTKELKKVQHYLKKGVFEFEQNIYRRFKHIIKSDEQSQMEFDLHMSYFTDEWNTFRKKKEDNAKKQLETAMKKFQK